MSRLFFGAIAGAMLLLAGCAGRFETSFAEPLDPAVSRGWTLVDVRTVVPDRLRVSEDNVLVPDADIVWHGDPPGDRRAQAAAVVAEGVRQGAAPLRGQRRVVFDIVITRFHGVTPVAMNRSPAAVHDVTFQITVRDARSRAVILGPVLVQASLLANTRTNAVLAAMQGETERKRIVDHIAATTAGWLGIGPDPRESFVSIGR